MNKFTAVEASRLTQESIEQSLVGYYVDGIIDKIKSEAKRGKRTLLNPYSHFFQWPDEEQEKLIVKKIRLLGYTVKYTCESKIDDKTIGFTRSAYMEIGW